MRLRCTHLARTYHLIALLRGGGASLEKLARETGVTQRTIRRDLLAIEAAGIPVTRTHENGSGEWKLLKGAPCPICGMHRASAAS